MIKFLEYWFNGKLLFSETVFIGLPHHIPSAIIRDGVLYGLSYVEQIGDTVQVHLTGPPAPPPRRSPVIDESRHSLDY